MRQIIEFILSVLAFLLLFCSPVYVFIMYMKKRLTVRKMVAFYFVVLIGLSLLLGLLVSLEFGIWALLISATLSLTMLISGWFGRDFWKRNGLEW